MTSQDGAGNRRAIAEYVGRFHVQRGYGPSVREVARGVGVHTSTAAYHIRLLVNAGVLAQTPGVVRSLRPAAGGYEVGDLVMLIGDRPSSARRITAVSPSGVRVRVDWLEGAEWERTESLVRVT